MRTPADRIRHALSFEAIALLIVTPLGAWAFDEPLTDIGVVAIGSATIATLWNYLYNYAFDHALLRWRGSPHNTVTLRLVHAVLFEFGLLFILAPFIAWYLDISLFRALLMDIGFAGFYLVYAFAFNWAYDVIYPVPGQPRAAR